LWVGLKLVLPPEREYPQMARGAEIYRERKRGGKAWLHFKPSLSNCAQKMRKLSARPRKTPKAPPPPPFASPLFKGQ